jgi:hypothetical protein
VADLPATRKVIYCGTFTEGRHRTELMSFAVEGWESISTRIGETL